MLQYQSEYDALSEKRVQEELERFKTMELALMRVEERKKYEREADTLRASLLQEQRQKSERLQEKERDLELAFVAKRTELETSLFETRQSLFQEMEKLRVKEAHLQVKVESDFRHFAAESKRLQLWEENVRAQEKNTARLVAQAIREKEHELQLERSRVNLSLKVREDELAERETVVECEKEAVKTEKLKRKALMDDVARMEERLQNMEQSLNDANKAVTRLEKENKRLQDAMDAKEANAEREKGSLSHLSALNARLAAEKELLQQEIDRYRVQMSEDEILVKQLTFELKDAQQQLLAIKMDEANALVGERKRFMKALDDDREQFQWKENELLVKLREFQGRLAESEAAVEKFHSQYEDEKLHVESLRQEVGNLNALLSQAQATINAKHGTVALHRSSRPVGGGGGSMEMGASAGGDFGSDRMMMIKMMEMMTRFQSGPQFMQQYPQPVVAHQSSIPVSYSPAYGSQTSFVPGATITAEQQAVENDEEDKKLRDEQLRIERELLEQREYERKKAERMAQEELEIAARKKLFDEELARQRQARVEEDERLESERRRNLAEEEQKMQSELEKQRRTLQEASELRQQLAEERSAADKQRMQDEQAYQERMRAENLRLEQELEAKSLQKEKEEAEAEKRRREAEARKLQEQQQEEEEHEKQEKVKREVERQREEADVAAVEAARCEEAEEEQRRQRELEMLEKRKREEGKEREQATADLRLREEQEEQKLNDGDYAQDTHEREAPVLATDLLKTVEPDAHEVAPVADSVPESSQSAQSDEVGESESTAAAEVPSEAVNKLESSAVETTNEPKDERGDIGTTTPTAEEESRELTEEEQRQAEEEEKKKQADATMDIYRQRVLARKAAEKQKQLEMDAEAAARKRQEEEAEAERRRQEEQADGDSGQEEMELSGGSFAESRYEILHQPGLLWRVLEAL